MSEDYLNGAKAAWEMAQDIMCMNKKDLQKFDATDPKSVICMKYEYVLPIYESFPKRLETGDVVIYRGTKGVVTKVWSDGVLVLLEDGTTFIVDNSDLERTEDHLDITGMLRGL